MDKRVNTSHEKEEDKLGHRIKNVDISTKKEKPCLWKIIGKYNFLFYYIHSSDLDTDSFNIHIHIKGTLIYITNKKEGI